jgi:hypothetical protein
MLNLNYKKMKKFIFSAIVLSVVLVSCNKEEIEPENENQRTVVTEHQQQNFTDNNDYSKLKVTENGVLEFETIEYYEQFVNSDEPGDPKIDFLTAHIKENLKFNSLASTIQNREGDAFEDEFINSILDKNNVVKIGKWYIRLNPETEKVYAVSEQITNAYELVLREDESNSNTYTFTFDDEVLTYLADESLLNDRKLFCKDRRAISTSNQTSYTGIPIDGTSVGMLVKASYVKLGIYYALKAKSIYGNNYTNYLHYWFQFDNCSYNQRCGSSLSNYSHPWITPSNSTVTNAGNEVRITYRLYSNVKQLKNYTFKVRVRCENSFQATPATPPYIVIFSDYAIISDY